MTPLPTATRNWLAGTGLARLWKAARKRLEHNGLQTTGALRLSSLEAQERTELSLLLGRPITGAAATVRLDALDARLGSSAAGLGLKDVRQELGPPLTDRRAAREAAQARREQVWSSFATSLETSPLADQERAQQWYEAIRSAGMYRLCMSTYFNCGLRSRPGAELRVLTWSVGFGLASAGSAGARGYWGKGIMNNKRAKFVSAAVVAVFATTSAVAAGATSAMTADGTGGGVARSDSASPRDESKFKLADPDTVLTDQGDYITYGTSSAGTKCGGAKHGFKVPMLRHGSGDDVGIADCAVGDALPKKNIGDWADKSSGVWAPGVVKHKGKYLMYYTMSRKGSKQKCIGLARSTDANGPFKDGGSRPWACPASGRWVIDANPYVAGGQLYVAYRDDQVAQGIESGVSVVGAGDNGWADKDFSSRRTAITSNDIAWDSAKNKGHNHIVENPSMFKVGKSWYLAYSANAWDSARYATGIAECGTKPIPRSRCTPMRNGVKRPYFGFKGKGGLGPWRGLPGNHPGPGGMDIFQAQNGSHRAVYHWFQRSDKTRYPITGTFVRHNGGFAVK